MAVSIGSVSIDVVPNAEGFVNELRGKILPNAGKLGEELGEEIGKAAGKAAADEIGDGIEDGVRHADPEGESAKKGKSAGGAFARTFKAEVEAALRDLPDINIDADTSEAAASIQAIREQLKELSTKNVGVDITGSDALAKIRAIRLELESIRDQRVEIEFDTQSAMDNLGKLERQIAADLGGSFDRTLRSSLSNALKDLPKINVDADTDAAVAKLQEIRTELAAMSDFADINVNIDADASLAEIERLTTQLQALVNDESVDLKVRFDAAQALAGLESVRTAMERVTASTEEADREIGQFARSLKTQLEAAIRSIPDIVIDADSTPAERRLAALRTQFLDLKDMQIGVDIDAAGAEAAIASLAAELEFLSNDTVQVDVEIDALGALAALRAFQAEIAAARTRIEVEVEAPNPGAFITKMKALIESAQNTLPDIQVDADTTPANAEIAALRLRLGELNASIDINTNIPAVMAEIALIRAALEAIDGQDVEINVRTDAAGAVAELAAVGAAAAVAGDTGGASFSRMRLIMAAVVALFPIIAAAIIALAGAFALVVTPIAAIAAGLDGLKAAVAPLLDELNTLKAAVSAVFVAELPAAIANVERLFPTLTTGLVGTATALSTVAVQVTAVATSGANLPIIGDSFERINGIILAGAPAISSLTQNLITLTNIGTQGMALFATQMDQVGTTWRLVIDSLTDTGRGVESVQALFTILASLLNLIAPLTELGATMLAAFGPALAGAIDLIAAALGVINNVLALIPGPVLAMVTAVGLLVAILAILGISLPTTATQIAFLSGAFASLPGFAAAAGGAIRAFGAAMLSLLTNPIVLTIAAITAGLTLLTGSQQKAAAAAQAHDAAVSALSADLAKTSGNVTDSTRELVTNSDSYKKVADAAKGLGVDLGTVTDAATGNGAAWETVRKALQDNIDAHSTFGPMVQNTDQGVRVFSKSLDSEALASYNALVALGDLNQTYIDAQQHVKDMSAALREQGVSTVSGLANADALKNSLKTLGDAMSTTTDKAKALLDALNILTGGTLPFEQANAKLRDTIRDLGKGFEEAGKAAKEIHQPLIDASGAINTNTDAGNALLTMTMGLRDGMTQTATAAFDQAGGMSNVAVASKAASDVVQGSRDAFTNAAIAAGVNATAAQELADRYGLIPSLVVTLLQAQGIPLVQQDLNMVQGLLRGMPSNVPINIGVISAQAEQILRDIGFQVTHMEDGTVVITATDKTKDTLDAAVATINNNPGGKIKIGADGKPLTDQLPAVAAQVTGAPEAKLPVGANGQPLGAQIPGLLGQIETSRADLPVGANTTAVPPAVAAATGAITGAPPAQLPVGADTAAVQPAAQTAAAQVSTITALINIDVGSKAGIETWIANLQRTIATPINMSIGVYDNATSVIQRIMAAANAPAQFTIVAIDSGVTAMIETIRGNAQAGAQFTITGVDSGVQGLIDGLRGSAQQGAQMPVIVTDNATATINAIRSNAQTISVMPIDANPAGANGKLQALVSSVTGTTATMKIDAAPDLGTGKLQALVAAVTGTTAIMKIDADPGLADGKLSDLVGRINRTTGTVLINANTATAETALNNLARPRTTTLTVNIVTNGQLPNANGNIVPAGFKLFANGGMHNGKLSPMQGGYARMVQPNTFRVIGDNARYPEAYIPINPSSARSRGLLKVAAAGMGYGVTPMATGGLLNTASDPIRLSQLTTESPLTAAPGSLAPLSGDTRTVEKKLDQLIQITAANPRQPASITVNDRSGNPTETARATQLAMRLAR